MLLFAAGHSKYGRLGGRPRGLNPRYFALGSDNQVEPLRYDGHNI